MNGGEIFTFTLREVPTLVQNAREDAGWEIEDVDAFVFHQANRFMLQHLAKKMKLPQDRVVVALENFGNTSSASIPLAITHSLATRLKTESLRLMLVGFGVGYSWGAIALSCGPLILPDLILVPSPTAQKRLANADI
jgi:3-oxoacyl-[acyl-carrier-protein] synthase-3